MERGASHGHALDPAHTPACALPLSRLVSPLCGAAPSQPGPHPEPTPSPSPPRLTSHYPGSPRPAAATHLACLSPTTHATPHLPRPTPLRLYLASPPYISVSLHDSGPRPVTATHLACLSPTTHATPRLSRPTPLRLHLVSLSSRRISLHDGSPRSAATPSLLFFSQLLPRPTTHLL